MAGREGEQIGNYRLLHFLKWNGADQVYLAEDTINENIVTIKLTDWQSNEEFFRRAEWLTKLKHRNILSGNSENLVKMPQNYNDCNILIFYARWITE
jgi:hypothetical protein